MPQKHPSSSSPSPAAPPSAARRKPADGPTRIERDSLGPMDVPAEAYYGAQTARAMQNFVVSGEPMPIPFVVCLATLKKAAAEGVSGFL